MSQNDFTIANQGFPAFRADLNSALQALATNNSGTSAPSTTFANMWWYDSANNIMYIRNEDNDAWIKFAELDQTNDKFVLSGTLQLDDGSASAPALTFNSDTNMGIYRGGTDILTFVTAGTDAISIDASQNTTFAGDIVVYENDSTNNAVRLAGDANEGFVQVYEDGVQQIQLRGDGNSYINGGNLGIGTDSPSQLLSLASNNPAILLTDEDNTISQTGFLGNISAEDSAGTKVWVVGRQFGSTAFIVANKENTATIFQTNGTETLRIQAGGGISFNGETSADNALSAYEEGSFNPTAEDESGNTGTTSEATGYYRKIGGLVHCEIRLTNINTTGLTSSNDFVIGGFPFTNSSRDGSVFGVTGDVYFNSTNFDYTGNIIGLMSEGADSIKFVELVDSAGDHDILVSDLSSGVTDVLMSITYHTEQ